MTTRIFAVVAAVAFVANGAFAAAAAHEAKKCELIFGGTTGNSRALTTAGSLDLGSGFGDFSIGASAGFNHSFTDELQLGGMLMAGFQNAQATNKFGFMALVGPTFNFMNSTAGDISDAMFVMAGAGLNMAIGTGTAQFIFGGEIGKRMPLWDNVSYRPSFSVAVENSLLYMSVKFLNISIMY